MLVHKLIGTGPPEAMRPPSAARHPAMGRHRAGCSLARLVVGTPAATGVAHATSLQSSSC